MSIRVLRKRPVGRVEYKDDMFWISFRYDPRLVENVKKIPGRKWNPDKKQWSAPKTSAEIVMRFAKHFGLDYDKALEDYKRSLENQKLYKCERFDDLVEFQKEAVKRLQNNKRFFLFYEMGLGKTVISLCAIFPNKKVIVICPASMVLVWKEAAGEWRKDYTAYAVKSKKDFRLPKAGEICVTSPKLIPDNAELGEDFIVIVDEVQMCKNKRTKNFKIVRSVVEQGEYAWGLTGTPIMRNPLDLWNEFELFDVAKAAFGNFKRYMAMFGAYRDRWGRIVWFRPNQYARKAIRLYSHSLLRVEVLDDLPDKLIQRIPVDVDKATSKELDKLLKDWDEHTARMVKATQYELPPFEMFSKMRSALAKVKIPAMLEIVERFEEMNQPLVVFSSYLAPIEELEKRNGWRVIKGSISKKERKEIVDMFQARKLKGIALTIGAGSTGLTLTEAHNMLFVDLDWNPANNEQAESRIIRIGQKSNKVRIMHLVANHSLDHRLFKILRIKKGFMKVLEKDNERKTGKDGQRL